MLEFSEKSLESKMSRTPAISVVMPAFNAERYLGEAIESILSQTFTDFEFIIINDGSTDKTESIIQSYKDPRIVYIKNNTNLGLSKSFNIGIERATGQYIARMDADDVSVPERFATQISLLKRKPHVDLVGSSIWRIDKDGNKLGVHSRPEKHMEIKFMSLFSTPMIHPTIMGRTETFKTHRYNEDFFNSEDYELWSRLLFHTSTRFSNILEPLLLYRAFPNSFTQTLNLDKRAVSAHNTIQNIKHYVKLSPSEEEFLVRFKQERKLSISQICSIFYIYLRAAQAFCKKEKLRLGTSLKVYARLLPLAVFLTKQKIKQLV